MCVDLDDCMALSLDRGELTDLSLLVDRNPTVRLPIELIGSEDSK